MKKAILKELNKIKKFASTCPVEGKLTLSFEGYTVAEYDEAIASITEFPRFNHFIEITPKLTVTIILN